MARVKTQVKVEVETKAPAWYAHLFQELFPDVWHEFAKGLVRETLLEVLADNDADFVRATNQAPPVDVFWNLINERYFPVSEFWLDFVSEAEEGDEYAWHEIPIETIFYLYDQDPHDLMPVFQLIATLTGEASYHADCSRRDACSLRPVYLIAANELHKVDERLLAGLCRRESTPLKHLSFARLALKQDTGNIWFDYSEEMYGHTGCEWNAGMVRALKRDYQAAEKLADGVIELNNYLTEDVRRIRDASALWRRCAV